MGDLARAMTVLCLGVSAVCCGVRSPETVRAQGECTTDADCADEKTCVRSRCVQCLTDEECGCHHSCVNHTCAPLAPSEGSPPVHAHGTWRREPGSDGPSFAGLCTSEQQCSIGEICNALTGGCVPAADYQIACEDDRTCPTGAVGEMLACDRSAGLCLPAPRCLSDFNCCGVEGLTCDAGAGLCLEKRTECTPPAEIISVCPLDPRQTEGCPPGLFCSAVGRCVQCGCDEDCPDDSGLPRCYLATGLCVSATYCVSAEECTDEGMSCDSIRRQCAPRCDSDGDCDEALYCVDTDKVCRPVSERPCEPDPYEPNDDVTAVRDSHRFLPLPELDGISTVEQLSLCVNDVDWYALALERGARVVLTGTSEELSAEMQAFAPDGATELASGSISSWGGYALDFTANIVGTHLVSVTRSPSSRGYYDLSVALLVGELCIDPLEDGIDGQPGSPNNLPAQATAFYDFTGAGALLDGEACALETDGGSEMVTCQGSLLKLCAGDADYYTIKVPPASLVRAAVWNFGGNLDLAVYGPYAVDEPVDTSRLAGMAANYWGDEHVQTPARAGGTLLVHVFRGFGEPSAYDLDVEVSTSEIACAEDPFDGDEPGVLGVADGGSLALEDAASYNDQPSRATWVGLAGEAPVELGGAAGPGLTLCGADQDWFRLGVQDSDGTFTDLPPGVRVGAAVQVGAAIPATSLTVAAGTGSGAMTFGSADPANPVRRLVLAPTLGGPNYVQVVAAADNTLTVSYGLTLQIAMPPPCDLDVLGDLAESRNDAPATATRLTSPPWPQAVGESFVFDARTAAEPSAGEPPTDDAATLSLCGLDADWYLIDAPADASVLATVRHEPTAGSVGLAVLDESVAAITEPTAGSVPAQGILDLARPAETGYVRALGDPPTGPVYIVVYNRAGWPLDDYRLGVALVPGGCPADAWEPNDSWSEAAPLQLTPDPTERGVELGFLDPLTVCDESSDGGSHDWFSVALGEGDQLRVRAYYHPEEGDLDIDLRGPTEQGGYIAGEADDAYANQDSRLEVQHTVAPGKGGAYRVQITPYGVNKNHYYLETLVRRGCTDDDLEPLPPAQWSELPWSAARTHEELVLCNDEDWYAVAVLGPEAPASTRTVTVCTDFIHGRGDIDVQVYSAPPAEATGHQVASSCTKADGERAVFTVTEAHVYFIRVFLDSRDNANTTYDLSILDGDQPCP